MTETQRRIKIYKQALPHLKERVTAVAILLAISVSMMATASFAWITLSAAPEVNGLATTVSTNGNLEIALSNINGVAPNESAVGDGAGEITDTNLTWGNLINLSDESYGLDYLTLRPASLETGKLLTSPLKSVTYGEDGRISGTISNFAYTNFRKDDSGVAAFFVPDNGTEYGVRAISSVTYNSVVGDAMIISLANAVETNRVRAEVAFTDIYHNDKYMNAITGLAGVYLTYRDEDVDQPCTQYVEPIYQMLQDYIACMDYVGQSLLAAANLHHFVYCNKNLIAYTAFTIDDIQDGTAQATLGREGVTLSSLATYQNMVRKFYGYGTNPGAYQPVKTAYDNKSYMGWEALNGPVNIMANIQSTTVNGTPASQLDKDTLLGMAGNVIGGGSVKCVIQQGLILDMEKLLGTGLQVKGLRMTATLKGVPLNVNADVSCNVSEPYYLVQDAIAAEEKAAAGGLVASDAVAADTYGMALDFWLRTNAFNSKLKLEGELIYENREVIGPDGQPELDENGNPKKEKVAVGYAGTNRIWDENDPGLPEIGTSTSQGTGSCYVFYPSSEEDKIQSLNLLRAMCIAFVSEDGTLLAQADLDTANALETYGRVLVPMQLRAKTVTVIDPETNEEKEVQESFITNMVQNEATRITALVYLDGSMLTNSEVLAASSINGHLNIQFGTDEDISSMNQPDLKDDYYKIALSATTTKFNSFDPNNKPKTKLTLELDGMEANTITGNFVSYISQTQGARQPTFSFTHKGGKIWEAEVTFDSAGNFELRSVQIDGVDCLIDEDQVVRVEIKGVAVSNVVCLGWNNPSTFSLMTADSYYQLNMEMDLSIGEGIRTPSDVRAVFNHSGGQNVTLSFSPRSSTKWTAKGNFTASGKYTLSYVLIDGAVVALNGTQVKTMDLTLGVKVRTFLNRPVNEEYRLLSAEMATALKNASEDDYDSVKADYENRLKDLLEALDIADPNDDKDGLELTNTPNGYRFYHDGSQTLFMDVTCIIENDKDDEITNLSGTWLYYAVGNNTEGRPSCRLTWNTMKQCYEGTLEITAPGTYSFQYLTIPVAGEPEPMYITSSPGAPKIQAISPNPISYRGKSAINSKDTLVNITPNANRWIGFVLRDAASAEATITVRHTGAAASAQAYRTALGLSETIPVITNPGGTFSYDLTVEASKVSDEVEGDWFFYVDAPHDGTWQITDFQIYSAFYGGTFYDGTEEGTGYLTADAMGVDLEEEDKIASFFFTTVKFNASDNVPGILNGKEFMQSNFNKAITFKLTDYLNNPINGAGVHLSYTWAGEESMNTKFSRTSGTIPDAWKTLGGDLTAAADGSFTTPVLDFRLDGNYLCDFSVTYNGREYDVSKFTSVGKEFTADNVTVYWDLPVLKITALTGATKNSVNNTKYTVNLATDRSLGNTPLSGVQNYFEDYYANTYIAGERGSYSVPELTMELSSAGETGQVEFTIGSDGTATYKFTGNDTSDTQEIGSETWGRARNRLGTAKITTLNLSYGGVIFKATLDNAVTIKQDANPTSYVTLNYDSDIFNTSSLKLNATSSNGTAFTVNVNGANPMSVVSPDGRDFTVTLPKLFRENKGLFNDDYSSDPTFDNKAGTAVEGDLVYYRFTKSVWNGCGYDDVAYYTPYQRYERVKTLNGTRYWYDETYTVDQWGSHAADTELTVTSGTALTAADPTYRRIDVESQPLVGKNITEYCYKAGTEVEGTPPSGKPSYTDTSVIVTDWTEIAAS